MAVSNRRGAEFNDPVMPATLKGSWHEPLRASASNPGRHAENVVGKSEGEGGGGA